MATNPNYVKFMRGTLAAYNKLETKEPNTLYFLSDNDGKEGALYLGSKLIAGPDVAGATLLNELNDVMLTPGMDYDAILMYDSVELKWRDYSFDALTFRAETEQLKGAAGFVPAPSKDEHNKFLRGDGTWAIVGTECQIFNIETSEGQSHSNALAAHTGDKILNKGDIAIIQDFIVNGKFQYTSYVYNGSKEQPQLWCALDKEYNAKNVYLDSDIVFTNKHNIEETLTVSSKNLKEALELVLERAETSVLADAKTVSFDNNVLSLKDFGKQYYKYIAESGSKETNDYQPAHYVLQVVDAEHPWKSGLEPKVVSENGVLGLGWYEPNPTTIEGVNAAIAGLQNTVNNLIIDNTNLSTRIDNTYTKTETNAAIAAAAHLKRMEVSSIASIDPDADGADQYIYMVPSGLTAEDNKYYEYMVIEVNGVKSVERVGSWEVDLSDYLKKADAEISHTEIQNTIKALNDEIQRVNNKAEINFINSVSEDFSVSADQDRKLSLTSVPSTIDLSQNTSLLDLFVKKNDIDLTKLASIEMNAEQNVIDAIDENEFSISEIERKLSVNKISGAKIINLDANEAFSSVKTAVSTAQNNIQSIQSALNDINQQITNVTTNYVQKSVYNEDMSNVWDRLTWHDLI